MNTHHQNNPRKFYLVSVDILQGLSVFIMVIGHTLMWWDPDVDFNYPNIALIPWLVFTIALVVPAGFIFWYSFNVVNSLLRRTTETERLDSRSRLLKRTVIFFLIGVFLEVSAAVVAFPDLLLNYLLTWGLFHMFSGATLFLLIAFELSWEIEARTSRNHREISIVVLFLSLVVILFLFLVFHDYNPSSRMEYYSELNIASIFSHAVFEEGQSPIIPFLAFSAGGGLVASYLDLPRENRAKIIRKSAVIIFIGVITLVIGLVYLTVDPYRSPPVIYPSSASNVFISLGFLFVVTTGLILIIDLDSLHVHQKVNKILYSIALLGEITLTIYIVHNVAFWIPVDHPFIRTLVSDIDIAALAGFIYTMLFILAGYIWKKYDFKYSLEWLLGRLQRAKWKKSLDYSKKIA